ncbi:PaaI family thioesterase [Cohnella sp. LGH]|uniref:PaaI family thioesterase n=1 Tax=Cohnella sp. LGH TaxID=1619153 RepID=UPI001ADAD59E|nr:PaaI family thioesterase [Cohnella sp. LGH]QTH41794.1 PaaI family thioesterase [Cohnella sp. LGH]
MASSEENELPPQLEQWKAKAESTFWGWVGCSFERVDERRTVVSLDIEPRHLNLIGILHGGVHATMIDSAMGLAAMLARPEAAVVTTHLNMNYVAPVREGRIFVEAEIAHMSRITVTTQARVRTADGELLAFGNGTFRVLE